MTLTEKEIRDIYDSLENCFKVDFSEFKKRCKN